MTAKNSPAIPLLKRKILQKFDVSPETATQIAKQVEAAFRRYVREKSQQMRAHSFLRESGLLEDFANSLDKCLQREFNKWKRERRYHLQEELKFGWLPLVGMRETNRTISDAESEMESWISPVQEVIKKIRKSAKGYRNKAEGSDPGIDRNRQGGKRSSKPLANLWKELRKISTPLGCTGPANLRVVFLGRYPLSHKRLLFPPKTKGRKSFGGPNSCKSEALHGKLLNLVVSKNSSEAKIFESWLKLLIRHAQEKLERTDHRSKATKTLN